MGTAIQLCARGDWDNRQHDWANHMSWLSVYNKLDFVRLHAASLHVYSLWVRITLLCCAPLRAAGCKILSLQ